MFGLAQRMQMLDERISLELDVIDASRDAKEAVAKEKSRQKTAEWRLEQLARQRSEVDAELTKMKKTLLKEQVSSPCCSYTHSTCRTVEHWGDRFVCLVVWLQDRKQQMTLKLGAVMNASVQQPLPIQPNQVRGASDAEYTRLMHSLSSLGCSHITWRLQCVYRLLSKGRTSRFA